MEYVKTNSESSLNGMFSPSLIESTEDKIKNCSNCGHCARFLPSGAWAVMPYCSNQMYTHRYPVSEREVCLLFEDSQGVRA